MCPRWQHKSRAHGGDPGSLAHSIKARVDVLRFLGSRRDNSGIQWGYFEDHMGIIDLFLATWYRCEWGVFGRENGLISLHLCSNIVILCSKGSRVFTYGIPWDHRIIRLILDFVPIKDFKAYNDPFSSVVVFHSRLTA